MFKTFDLMQQKHTHYISIFENLQLKAKYIKALILQSTL